MKLGFIGLGRMGHAMVENLLEKGHEVVAYDVNQDAVQDLAGKVATGAASIADLVAELDTPRAVWLMVTRKFVDNVLNELTPLLTEGDTVIDGGNSFYKDSIRRYDELQTKGIHFLDTGTSGGIEGARHGACMMIGGEREVFDRFESLYRDMCVEDGYGYMGGPGAGHFVKMIHNGVEYGMMGAIAEGVSAIRDHHEQFGTDLETVTKVYAHGSIIESRLMTWLLDSYQTAGYLDGIEGTVPYGETEEEMEHVVEIADTPVLKAAVDQRVATRENATYTGKLIAAMRNQFGGHAVTKKEK